MKGLLIGAPTSGSGKTILTLAMLRALKNAGIKVAPAKAGPDFIDPAFHALAAGEQSYNLDAWAMRQNLVNALSAQCIQGGKTLIVEGVMGLFDGAADGKGSSADLAHMLCLPVVLVVDCARQSHSVAALVLGFKTFRPNLHIAGLILNKVGSHRHEQMLRRALEPIAIPILGVIQRDDALFLPERHLGLVQAQELPMIEKFITDAAELFTRSVALDELICISKYPSKQEHETTVPRLAPLGQHIAVAHDDAFSFIYPHLLDGWRKSGAEISFFSPLKDEAPSKNADAVYLCGGYPELHAGTLADAKNFKKALKQAAGQGKVIYGECGGYITLGAGLVDKEGKKHEMLGLLPLETSFAARKLHLGYRRLTPLADFVWKKQLCGHEFHYASIVSEKGAKPLFKAYDALGTELGEIGLICGRVAGSFTHIIDMSDAL